MPLINTIDPLFTSERARERYRDRDEEVSREIKKGAYLVLSILYLLLTLIKEGETEGQTTQRKRNQWKWGTA